MNRTGVESEKREKGEERERKRLNNKWIVVWEEVGGGF